MSVVSTGTVRGSEAGHRNALPSGFKLHWYQMQSVLGQGSFGITYLAKDLNLGQKVAIKEFLPTELSVREEDSSVRPVAPDKAEAFSWGLKRFLSEAQTLADFKHPNIVRVLSVFQENNTAYMVMEYEQGESMEAALKHHRIQGERRLREALFPILDGLERVHEAGFIHRDIKPSNIYLRADDSPVLLDFGSARQAIGAETRTVTTVVTPGYAPFEQYSANPDSDKQGLWTDIYGAAATLYRAVTGKPPLDGVTRAHVILEGKPDPVEPAIEVGKNWYSPEFLAAIDCGLKFQYAERPRCVAQWRALFEASPVESYPVQATVRLRDTVRDGDRAGEADRKAAQPRSEDNAHALREQPPR
jgi:serine/threonine protein kinase